MRRLLIGVDALLAIVLFALVVAGTASAQDPTPSPEATTIPAAALQQRHVLAEAVADMLGMTPGQLLDAELAGQALLDIAEDKGVTEQQLVDAVQAAQKQALDQAVKGGRITQEEADRMTQGPGNPPGTPAAPSDSGQTRRRGNAGESMLDRVIPGNTPVSKAVAALLGMTPGQLLDARLTGQNVLDIAKQKNLTDQQLADAILSAHKEALDQAVTSGRLTQAQADSSLESLKAMTPSDLLNRLDTLDGGGPGAGPRGDGRPFGGPGRGRNGMDAPPAPEITATP